MRKTKVRSIDTEQKIVHFPKSGIGYGTISETKDILNSVVQSEVIFYKYFASTESLPGRVRK